MSRKRMARVFAVIGLLLFGLWHLFSARACAGDTFLCADGAYVPRIGRECSFRCTDDESHMLQAELLWNAPLHSWTGVASEAVDFLVPLARRLPNLGLVGGFVEEYVGELPLSDLARIRHVRERGAAMVLPDATHAALRIYLTQYDPGSYDGDFTRYRLENMDYRVGRAMFETTKIPSTWLAPLRRMDEIWVPSKWGAERFVAAGLEKSRVVVVPEAVDVSHFDPEVVPRNRSLLPDCGNSFVFLSVFKWEQRKGWDVLLTAFLTTFTNSERVALYIRAGDPQNAKFELDMVVLKLKIRHPPKIVFLPRVPSSDYARLFRAADAFVLATHAEGWGRPLAEAMTIGLPTIAPAWSGQTDFMTDRTAVLVPVAGLEEAFADQPQLVNYETGHQWARLDPARLGTAMRHVFDHPTTAAAMGRRAREHMVAHFSREVVAERVEGELRRIVAALRAKRQPRRVSKLVEH